MATETADEHRPNPWILYARELKFVALYTEGAIDAAEELLLEHLGNPGRRIIRWIYTQLDYGSFDPSQLEELKKVLLKAGYREEAVKTYLGRMLQFFWQPAEHTRIKVDRVNSGATRTGPPWIVESSSHIEFIDGKFVPVEQHWPLFFTNQPAVTIRVKLFKLHHDDVVAMLRIRGLLPLQQELPSSVEPRSNSTGAEQSSLSEQPASGEEPQAEETPQESLEPKWDPLTDWSVETVFRELEIKTRRQAPALEAIVKALPMLPNLPQRLKRYRGKNVVEILDAISGKDLATAVSQKSSDSAERIKRAWKRHRAKQGVFLG